MRMKKLDGNFAMRWRKPTTQEIEAQQFSFTRVYREKSVHWNREVTSTELVIPAGTICSSESRDHATSLANYLVSLSLA